MIGTRWAYESAHGAFVAKPPGGTSERFAVAVRHTAPQGVPPNDWTTVRRLIALPLVAATVAIPLSTAQGATAPSAKEKAAAGVAIAKHLHGKLKGIKHRLSSIDKKYMGVGWTKFIPGATADPADSDIPGVGIGTAYATKYGGKWVVLGHSYEKNKAEGCKKIPAAIRAEISGALKHVDVCK